MRMLWNVQEAKARVYKMVAAPPSKAASGSAAKTTAKVTPVLEEQPEWVLLRQVAEEIQAQRSLIKSLADKGQAANTNEVGGRNAPESAENKHPRKRARTESVNMHESAEGVEACVILTAG